MHLRRNILLRAALTALAAGSVQACPNHSTKTAVAATPRSAEAVALVAWKPRPWVPAALSSPQAQGLRAAIDPVDGAMGMPPASELQQELAIGDDTPVQIDRAPDGTLTAHLDERWAEYVVASIGPDGKPGWSCVHGNQGAVRFLRQPAVPVVPTTLKWEDK